MENACWVSDLVATNKSTLVAPMDFRTLNDMLFLDQLPDICGIVGAWAQLPTAEAREDLVQVLLGKVRNMLRRRTVYNHNFRHFISM